MLLRNLARSCTCVAGIATLVAALPCLLVRASALPHTGSAAARATARQKKGFKVGPYLLFLPAGSRVTHAVRDVTRLRRFVLSSPRNMKMGAMILRGTRGHPAAEAPDTVYEILKPATSHGLTAVLWAYHSPETNYETFYGTVYPAAAAPTKKTPYLIVITSGYRQAEGAVIEILKDVRTTRATPGESARRAHGRR